MINLLLSFTVNFCYNLLKKVKLLKYTNSYVKLLLIVKNEKTVKN